MRKEPDEVEQRSNKASVINPRAIVTGLGVTSILLGITMPLMDLGPWDLIVDLFRGDFVIAEICFGLTLVSALILFAVFVCIVARKGYWSAVNIACIFVGLAIITGYLALL